MSEHAPGTSTPPGSSGPSGNIHRLAELSFTRLDALDRRRAVVIFAVSPLEEHGPHLPVGTDLYDAEFFSEELAKRILEAKPGWTVLLGPSLPVGASAFDHAGTLRGRAARRGARRSCSRRLAPLWRAHALGERSRHLEISQRKVHGPARAFARAAADRGRARSHAGRRPRRALGDFSDSPHPAAARGPGLRLAEIGPLHPARRTSKKLSLASRKQARLYRLACRSGGRIWRGGPALAARHRVGRGPAGLRRGR